MENLSTITCAALTAMLANLTVGKAGSEENEQQTAQIIAAAGKLREELTALADDDCSCIRQIYGSI